MGGTVIKTYYSSQNNFVMCLLRREKANLVKKNGSLQLTEPSDNTNWIEAVGRLQYADTNLKGKLAVVLTGQNKN